MTLKGDSDSARSAVAGERRCSGKLMAHEHVLVRMVCVCRYVFTG